MAKKHKHSFSPIAFTQGEIYLPYEELDFGDSILIMECIECGEFGYQWLDNLRHS